MTKFIELKGGLGNQLFQYFAGQIIAKETSETVVFGLPDKRLHKIHHASTILDLDLPAIVDTEFLSSNRGSSPWRRGRQWLNRNSEISRKFFNRFSDTYASGTVGFDSNLQKFKESSFFEGYFQTYRYVAAFQEQTELSLSLKQPSQQYSLYLDRIIERQPIVIHIRRGDYKPLKKTVGMLGIEYYKNALRVLEKKNPEAPVWLFTDDLEGAEHVAGGLNSEFDQIVSPHSGLNAAETMLLMSESPSIVIANSTFSWWAAYLGSDTREVIAPSPWYRANSIKDELIPLNWKLTPSAWEN